MDIRMIFADETDKVLIDRNGSRWSFGDNWENKPQIRLVLLNGVEYKTSNGKGGYNKQRGPLMMLDEDGYVSILHGHRDMQVKKQDICRMCEPREATNWKEGWQCDWCDTPEWVRRTVNARYGG